MEKVFRNVRYRTLSPLHIGDGGILSNFEYIVHNGRAYFFEPKDLRKILPGKDFDQFINYTLSEDYPSLGSFLEKYGGKERLKAVSQMASYSRRYEVSGMPRRIWSFIKSRNKPYIPGSEVKGAIRTALVREVILKTPSLREFLLEEIRKLGVDYKNLLLLVKDKNLRFNQWVTASEFAGIPHKEIKLLFGNREGEKIIDRADREGKYPNRRWIKDRFAMRLGSIEDKISNRTLRTFKENDAKFDIMKFIFVSDAYSDIDGTFIGNVLVKNSSQRINEAHEIVPQDTSFLGGIAVDKTERAKKFFSLLNVDEERKSLFENLSLVLNTCYNITKDLIEEEIRVFKELKINSVVNQLEAIARDNKKDSPVIRIGKHQGFLSLTLAPLIKNSDQNLYKNVYVHLTRNTSYSAQYPKTKKLLVGLDKQELTLGWLKIEVE